VDLEQPDDPAFPRWRQVRPYLDVELAPGDCLYIPAGWPHAATTRTDSVSLTWNFVHGTHRVAFQRYLRAGGAQEATVRYFS
jgi:ribosomal protein L16 Arg81 hydroxylase